MCPGTTDDHSWKFKYLGNIMDKHNGLSLGEVRKSDINSTSTITLTRDAQLQEEGSGQQEIWKDRKVALPLGTMGALFHMIKGSLGSGILTMPLSFKNGGLWTSLVGAVVVGVIYTHCVHIFVSSSRVLCARVKKPTLEYAGMAEVAFQTGPPQCRPFATFAKNFVDAGLSLAYYLCCVVYIVFTASSIKQVVELNVDFSLNIRLYILAVTVFILPVGLIRNLKHLVPFSLVAILALVFGCGFVLYDVLQDLPPLSSRPAFTSFDRLPVFVATLIYSMDGIGTVLPIEHTMKKPEKFLGSFGVLNISVAFLLVLYCAMGFFGYLRYGEDTEGTITLNISSSILGQAVKLMVSLNVLCSYGLFLYVPCEIAWRVLKPRVPQNRETCSYYAMRVALILTTVLLAVAVPDLEPFVGLVGALFSSTLVLFFPAVIETVTFWEQGGTRLWRLGKNLLLVLVWLVVLVTGARSSIGDIVKLYSG